MRILHLLPLLGIVSLQASPQAPSALDSLPFDEWLKGKANAHFDWSLSASHATLSESQRLVVSVFAEIKGDEIRKRPGSGQLVMMMQIRDPENHIYRTRPAQIRVRGRAAPGGSVGWSQRMFLVPGDYDIAAALYDTVTKEHSLKRTRIHIASLNRDPLPDSWRGTPSVVLSPSSQPLPKLFLPMETKRPVRVEVILNQPVMGYQAGNLMARIEVISQIAIKNGSMGLRVLDLAHQKVLFSQESGEPLNMSEIGTVLDRGDPRIVHADVLSKYQEGAGFLVEQVRAALESKGPDVSHVVIVLSAPWDFPKDEGVPAVQAALPPQSRVFYVRCDSAGYTRYIPPPQETLKMRNAPRSGPGSGETDTVPNLVHVGPDNSDSLAGILKLLPARIFDVSTPAEFRRALGDIIREIGQLN
jgi:hypothetical protein